MKKIRIFSSNSQDEIIEKVNEFIQDVESINKEVIDIKFSTYKALYFNILIVYDEKSNGILEVWR